jgi:IclR family acetate operon transcriptional repressor
MRSALPDAPADDTGEQEPADDEGRTAGSRYNISAASHLIRILLALGEFDALTLQQAAETANVSKSTAYRLLRTLETFELVDRSAGGSGYRVGTRALRWAQSIERHQGVHGVADPVMRELHAVTGDLAGVVLFSESGLTWVGGVTGNPDAPQEVLFDSHADRVVPVHASGSGRAIGAHLPPDRLGALLGPEPYQQFTPATPTTWRQLRPLLEEARSLGYAIDREQVNRGTCGVASAFFAGGNVVGAISVAGPPSRFTEDHIAAVAEPVKLAAEKISTRLTPLRDLIAPETGVLVRSN